MSSKMLITLFLAMFSSFVASQTENLTAASQAENVTVPSQIVDVTGDALSTDSMLAIIKLAKDRLVIDRQACKDKMRVERVGEEFNHETGTLTMVFINVEPCTDSTNQTKISCKVEVLTTLFEPLPEVQTVECPPRPEN